MDALHVYGTNKQADQYNSSMLDKLHTKKYSIKSSDITKESHTRQLTINLEGKKWRDKGGLESNLVIAEKAIVRLTCNIDVADRLVNGVRGVIQKIITTQNGTVELILVKFEDESIGNGAKPSNHYQNQYPSTVPIHRFGVTFQYNNKVTIFRSQFPLVLAWTSTIHSVQGLTVDKIVVDLSRIFAAGSAYVALSRVRILEGLQQIFNFKKTAIREEKNVKKKMTHLQSRAIKFHWPLITNLCPEELFKICHWNVRGYLDHLSDIKRDAVICSSDVICFTETHLRETDIIYANSKPRVEYIVHRSDRHPAIDKGGIMMFIHPNCKPKPLNIQVHGLEFTGSAVQPVPDKILLIITIYRRTKTVSIQCFLFLLEELVSSTAVLSNKVVIVGDFNEDLLENNTRISDFLKQYAFRQLIQRPTTDQGSLLDHVYFNHNSTTITTEVCDTYYSDYDSVSLAIRKDTI